jgi:3-hydroxybutyryl-CoA dehydratase
VAVEAKFDTSVIGVEEEVGTFDITAEQIAAYCAAVGETNPLYTDEAVAKAGPYGGIIAPPGIVHSISIGNGPDAKINYGNTGFHAGEKMEVIAPMYPGDRITARIHVKELYEKTGRTGGMLFEVRRTIYSNQRGEPVVACEKSFVRREVVPGGSDD